MTTGRPYDMWRYQEVLPVRDPSQAVRLGEGWSPLIPLKDVLIKDEGRNPSGSFKARGAAVGVSRLRELGVRSVVIVSSGNAAGAWSIYGARAGISVVAILYEDTIPSARTECLLSGADVRVFRGGKDVGEGTRQEAVAKEGCFDVATMQEPLRLEGKKTMGYELVEQLGGQLPDVIVYPTAGGHGIVGLWKAFGEMQELGWIGDRRPRLVAVQLAGCAPLVQAVAEGADRCSPWGPVEVPACGLRTAKPYADRLILRALRDTAGTAVAVDPGEAFQTVRTTARTEGVLLCPEGGAALAGARNLARSGWIRPGERVVVFNTASAAKYTESYA